MVFNYVDVSACEKCRKKRDFHVGCYYMVNNDRMMDKFGFDEVLNQGLSSISMFFICDVVDGEQKLLPILYIRARNEKRKIVDLFSTSEKCLMQGIENVGVPIEKPTFIPLKGLVIDTMHNARMYEVWGKHQHELKQIVEQIEGRSIEEVIDKAITLAKESINSKLNNKATLTEEENEMYTLLSDIKKKGISYSNFKEQPKVKKKSFLGLKRLEKNKI